MGLFWQQSSPDGSWAVVVEETEQRVCYAYLLNRAIPERNENPIVADVWLYNLVAAPQIPEWTLPDAKERLPFLNAREFVVGDGTLGGVDPEQLAVLWSQDKKGLMIADIYLAGAHLARLKPGAKPGWSRLARRGNAVAIPLEE